MNCLLDTNIVSLAMSGNADVLQELTKLELGEAAISSVTYAEIDFGLKRMSAPVASRERKRELFERLLEHVDVLPWGRGEASAYADERLACERDGQRLDQADLMILAHAGSTGRALVTRDAALQRRDRKGPFRTRVLVW